MSERVWTLIELLNSARGYLEQKGIENPRGSAEALLGKTLSLPRIQLYLQHDRPLDADQIAAFRELIRRRAHHEPLQLLLGQVEFLNCQLEVCPGLLIPRPETEELAETLIARFASTNGSHPRRLLDIGTGTGCFAIALTKVIPGLEADALDIDFEALRCTERNALQNGVAGRVHAILGDLFSAQILSLLHPPYDLVVSNPPYITETDYSALAPEVRNFEAKRALVAPANGLAFYDRIAELLPALLQPDGMVAVEIGIGQQDDVASRLQTVMEQLEIKPDLASIPRMIIAKNVKVVLSSLQAL